MMRVARRPELTFTLLHLHSLTRLPISVGIVPFSAILGTLKLSVESNAIHSQKERKTFGHVLRRLIHTKVGEMSDG
jgi:hypothetical protein